jgi:hypothetical protein
MASLVDIVPQSIDYYFFVNRNELLLLNFTPRIMEANFNSANKTARLAPALFFLCLPLALWGEMYVPSKTFVALDPVATANSVLANEFIFRTAIVCHLAGTLIFVFMMLMFYRVFRPVDKHLARLMLVPLLAQIPVAFVISVFNYTALMILKSEARVTFDIAQQQETAYFLLRMHRYGITKLFLGLSFIPFGVVILRSGFTPRVIGILVIISGIGYLADSCCYFLMQRADYLMVGLYLRSTFLGFMVALVWFLVKGIHNRRPIENEIIETTRSVT